ncbi:MAG: methyltransferase [Bacteroidales bacterium]|nr:methyltransferase [Bacteroidales bacterium]MDY0215779.1 methyltransferase [Bacteroidales bacterium]
MGNFEFQFIQFGLNHSNSTMKIGTDAIVLGSLVENNQANSILEIGTGCGIISLMLAQRFQAKITAVEIDTRSAKQALDNISTSPWKKKIEVVQGDIRILNLSKKFDLIVSNPPYFQNDLRPDSSSKNQARHSETLTFDELCQTSSAHLAENGHLWIILPPRGFEQFSNKASKHSFYCTKQIDIFPSIQHSRTLIVSKWGKEKESMKKSRFHLRNINGTYSDEYQKATRAFHPNIFNQ